MKTYTIKKSKNYSGLHFRPLYKPTVMESELQFHPSMIYESNNSGWQKLCGFSRGHHHYSSFRFVWRCWDGMFEIAAYQYTNGIRYSRMMWQMPIDRMFVIATLEMNICIGIDNNVMYRFKTNNYRYHEVLETMSNLPAFGYALHPYYENPLAAQSGAPHDMLFRFNRLAFAR